MISEQEAEWLLDLLEQEDPLLREIAVMKKQGDTNKQIALRLGMAIGTVARNLQRIRAILGPRMVEHQ